MPPPEPSFLDIIMSGGQSALDGAGYLAQEAARGMTNLAGAPVDLVNASPMLMNLLPGEQGFTPFTETPVGGGESLWNLFTAPRDAAQDVMGVPIGDATTDSAGMRIAGRVANEIGAAALPVGGALMAGARMGVQGARQMGGPVGNFVESAAVNPAKFARKELLYAAGAGAGAGGLREVYSDGDPNTLTPEEATADIIGAILGYGATGGAEGMYHAGTDLTRLAMGEGTDLVKGAVTNELGRIAGAGPTPNTGVMDTSGLAAQLQGGTARVQQTIPNFVPSTGDVLKNPRVQALEYSRQSGPNSGMYTQRRMENQTAVNEAVDSLAPAASPGAYRDTALAVRDRTIGAADTALAQAQSEFEAAMAKVTPQMSGEARGQVVRGALDEALSKAREVERAAWADVQGEVDPTPLADSFDAITDALTESERRVVADMGGAIATPGILSPDAAPGPVASSVLDAYGRPMMKPPVKVRSMTDLAEITSLRSELTSGIREANGAGNTNKARIIEKYVQSIDGYLNGIPRLEPVLKAAREVSFDLNERFTRRGTPVAETLATRPSGGPLVPDSRVTPQFVQPNEGQASALPGLLKETGNAAPVRGAVGDEIKATAAPVAGDAAKTGPFVGRYSTVFEQFPDLRNDLLEAGQKGTLTAEARASKTRLERSLGTPDKAGTSTVGKYVAYGDERAVDAMSTVVNAREPAQAADELLAFVGDEPAAVEGARAAFWQLMTREGRSTGATTRGIAGEQPWRPASLSRFLEDPKNRAVAERLYRDNPEHLQNLDAIAQELKGLDTRVTAKAPNSSGTPQALAVNDVLPTTETLGAYGFAYQRGQIGLPFIGLRLASTMFRRATMKGRTAEYQELLDKALLDPNLAAALARENNPANAAAMARAAKAALGVRAGWIDEALAGDDSEDETTSAIMGAGE
jgi:hypothetical protein